jgi:putative membrane protein
MPTLSLVLMAVAALIHIGFFVLESLMWRRRGVYRIFGVRSDKEAVTMSFALFNQGFYNLFLALGALVGIAVGSDIVVNPRHDLLVFCALFMIGAAVVLVSGNRKLWRRPRPGWAAGSRHAGGSGGLEGRFRI